jgi:eukaryotic-like serine/threonine-protein kinase
MPKRADRWLTVTIALVAVALVLVLGVLFVFRPTTVPDVTLRSAEDATALLVQAGLSAGTTSQLATTSVGTGLVVQQRPAAESRMPRRSSVDLTLAVAPGRIPVPDLAGLDATAANQKLSAALFLPRRVDVFGVNATPGAIVSQVPSAGAEWLTGRPVAYAVSVGPDDGTAVEVPDVMGKSIDAAFSELRELGLQPVDFVTNIKTLDANVVVSQLPDGGLKVRRGTPVLLLFEAP